jgi:hypothetical protein
VVQTVVSDTQPASQARSVFYLLEPRFNPAIGAAALARWDCLVKARRSSRPPEITPVVQLRPDNANLALAKVGGSQQRTQRGQAPAAPLLGHPLEQDCVDGKL